jgi:hypothetical protein
MTGGKRGHYRKTSRCILGATDQALVAYPGHEEYSCGIGGVIPISIIQYATVSQRHTEEAEVEGEKRDTLSIRK